VPKSPNASISGLDAEPAAAPVLAT
jgi:hypothetical protein